MKGPSCASQSISNRLLIWTDIIPVNGQVVVGDQERQQFRSTYVLSCVINILGQRRTGEDIISAAHSIAVIQYLSRHKPLP